jgi:hypothetical protein
MPEWPQDSWEWLCVLWIACIATWGALAYVVWYIVDAFKTDK